MCFHAACFVAKSKEQGNLSSLTASYLLTKVNIFLGVEEMVWDKFPTNWKSKELSLTELTGAKNPLNHKNSGKIRVQQWVFETAMSHQAFV